MLFLHRLVPGGADRSYGIEVGRLAGLPEPVLQRARALLRLFESEQIVSGLGGRAGNVGIGASEQLGLFGNTPHAAVDELRRTDPNSMTPIEALVLVDRLVTLSRQG